MCHAMKLRAWTFAAIAVSASLWYIGVALALTGHTKVLWGAEKATHHAKHVAVKAKHGFYHTLGDRSLVTK
jgi:hypothetical protein